MKTDPPHSGAEPADDGLLTVGDVCAWFRVSRDWVYDEVEAGRLPYLRLGRRHLRFHRADLYDYLRSSSQRQVRTSRPEHGELELQDLESLD